jgi:hypothetical protein
MHLATDTSVMTDDATSSLSEWLAEYRSRPEPCEVELYRVTLPKAVASPESRHSVIAKLRVVRYDEPRNPRPTGGFYLLSENADGECLFDTWHEDVDAAFAQADYEYGVDRSAWSAAAT